MDVEYFKSWKFAFAIAAGITVLVTGFKVVNRPDLATQIAQRPATAAFPGGKPSADLQSKPLIEGMTQLSLTATLAELERYLTLNNNEIAWEPENDRAFVLRTTRVDPMTQVINSVAFQMKVYERSEIVNHDPALSSGAIAVTAMAINAEMVDPRIAQNALFQIQSEIELLRRRGAF
ncbi:hypothetical protein J5N58_21425 [Rhizobium cremeum]|uniref:hypothetical protein n=1 Tax=Rhizobium cremeum TaxID=2813827 RepID=UPI001FD37741|nr:hypothetical protein [Rhizobium cremeum]MCJ7997031.1 hypothetical protein [Rhizobium cremeum]MCJ8002249.1 hypothetical protein [Rhizobium cremeum]